MPRRASAILLFAATVRCFAQPAFEVADGHEAFWSVLATDCDFGPDGGFYVSDWVEGWELTGKGRIYRFADPKAAKKPEVYEFTYKQICFCAPVPPGKAGIGAYRLSSVEWRRLPPGRVGGEAGGTAGPGPVQYGAEAIHVYTGGVGQASLPCRD